MLLPLIHALVVAKPLELNMPPAIQSIDALLNKVSMDLKTAQNHTNYYDFLITLKGNMESLKQRMETTSAFSEDKLEGVLNVKPVSSYDELDPGSNVTFVIDGKHINFIKDVGKQPSFLTAETKGRKINLFKRDNKWDEFQRRCRRSQCIPCGGCPDSCKTVSIEGCTVGLFEDRGQTQYYEFAHYWSYEIFGSNAQGCVQGATTTYKTSYSSTKTWRTSFGLSGKIFEDVIGFSMGGGYDITSAYAWENIFTWTFNPCHAPANYIAFVPSAWIHWGNFKQLRMTDSQFGWTKDTLGWGAIQQNQWKEGSTELRGTYQPCKGYGLDYSVAPYRFCDPVPRGSFH